MVSVYISLFLVGSFNKHSLWVSNNKRGWKKILRSTLTIITLSVLLVATVSVLLINTDFENNKVLNPDRTTYYIPNWVKHNAYWWTQDMISDEEYSYTIDYLIDQGIIGQEKCIGRCMVESTGE